MESNKDDKDSKAKTKRVTPKKTIQRSVAPHLGDMSVHMAVEKSTKELLLTTEPTFVSSEETTKPAPLKIVSVKNIVLFPHHVAPLIAGKDWSNESIDRAVRIGGTIGVVSQRAGELPGANPDQDFFTVGTEAKVLKILRFPDNTCGAVVQGIRRFKIIDYMSRESGQLSAHVEYFKEELASETPASLDILAFGKALKQLVQKAIQLSPSIPKEASIFIDNIQDICYLAHLVVPYLSIDFAEKQALLEIESFEERLQRVHYFLTREIEILEISHKINTDVKTEVGKQQRKYYVREQMKMLQKELGELEGRASGSTPGDLNDMQERILKSKMSAESREAALREMERMAGMQAGSPEFTVSHTYVTWLLDLPWDIHSQTTLNLKNSEQILNHDHHGLKKVKKRIVEFLAVCALKKSLKGPIILFVGPPGVGKTSLGKSIAKCLGRKFVRIALGGVRDEAEIRGHRRTYIGSMPGKIIDSLKKAGSMDPVVLLDEIDKLSSDARGDPASALLEVLDPEQNHIFTDHYLNVPVDLSKIFFIATANSLHSIPAPLRDRMEVIELNSYTFDEKTHIAFEHLLPQVIEEHGLKDRLNVKFENAAMQDLIQRYTREAGVRQLKRELAGVLRGLARDYVENNSLQPQDKETKRKRLPVRTITSKDVRGFLGPEPFLEKKRSSVLPVGVATGLAWTPNGGEVLFIEAALITPGSGKFTLTGQLGDVMKESVQTAFSFIRAHPRECGVNIKSVGKKDIHIHFPEGAVKKDGPSAGVAALLSMVSLLSQKALPADIAMTGEISLRGDVLPVGGIKEKVLAAHRFGIKHVLIPSENQKDLEDIPQEISKELKITCVETLKEVFKIIL